VTTAALITTAGRAAMLGGVVLAGPSISCEVAIDKTNDPVQVDEDGSFRNGDLHAGPTGWDRMSGFAPSDLGSGKVSQIVGLATPSCSTDEVLVVSDCFAAQAIALWGRAEPLQGEPEGDWGRDNAVANLLPPSGPLRLDAGVAVAALLEAAQAAEIAFVVMGKEDGHWAPWMSYPLHRGCKIYYPGSPGAK
jgi:hypothetical protein